MSFSEIANYNFLFSTVYSYIVKKPQMNTGQTPIFSFSSVCICGYVCPLGYFGSELQL